MPRPAVFAPAALAALIALAPAAGAAPSKPRVVVLGFDGADAGLIERYMAEGHLPNLSRLREEGFYGRLAPTNPPQTPVSWSTFATGLDPGSTEIFDFLKRNPADYLPDFAMNSETRRRFLFGESNVLVVGLLAGAAALVIGIGGSKILRLRWITAGIVGLVLGAGAGAAAAAAARMLPAEIPDAVNHRKGTSLWGYADSQGLRAQVIHVPATFPAEESKTGRMISGLGVPDMRGRVGTPSFYTSNPAFQPGDNEFSLELVRLPARRGHIETWVVGPYNKPFYDYVVDRRSASAPPARQAAERREARRDLDDAGVPRRLDLPMTLEVTDTDCTIRVSGQALTLRVGEWSPFVELDFPVNALVDAVSPLRGLVRFKLLKLEPELELYLSPLNFHPDCHPIAFTYPPEYSEEIRERFGLFKTIGWPEDTWSLPSGVGDEELFLEDMWFTLAKDREIMRGLLADRKDDLYIQIFYFTDRIGHLFWQFIDEGHPRHDAAKAARYLPVVLEAYKKMDEVVGEARRIVGEDAHFIVLSDHGFSSFRRGVNYNTWLVRNGFMTLKGQNETVNLEKLFDTRELFVNVDWSRTKAYALGLGSIYINLLGRERDGIVQPGEEYREVCEKIRQGLEALEDPKDGSRPVRKVWTREEIYARGFDPTLIPDLRAGNALNFRVSWQTTLGAVPPEIMEDNLRAWSGDHCSSDPAVIPGILFYNRKLSAQDPRMIDMMPTILKMLGLGPPEGLHGRALM